MSTVDIEPEYELDRWGELRPLVDKIMEKYRFMNSKFDDSHKFRLKAPPVLFRGHADSAWKAETTLERNTPTKFTVREYLRRAMSCSHEIESISGKNWKIPTYPELISEMNEIVTRADMSLPHYDYLVYLRHHGFPSPLLDWTESPFVAAYFAFADQGKVPPKRIEIQAYVGTPYLTTSEWVGSAKITVRGPHVTTHARHFAQKAWYTVATEWSDTENTRQFVPHEGLFEHPSGDRDIRIKITIPASERAVALRDLDLCNINHFTLFQTEDALVKALAHRQFDLRED